MFITNIQHIKSRIEIYLYRYFSMNSKHIFMQHHLEYQLQAAYFESIFI